MARDTPTSESTVQPLMPSPSLIPIQDQEIQILKSNQVEPLARETTIDLDNIPTMVTGQKEDCANFEMVVGQVTDVKKSLKTASQLYTEQQKLRKKREMEMKEKLLAIKVAPQDVAILSKEFDLFPDVADHKLREHGGNLAETIQTLLH